MNYTVINSLVTGVNPEGSNNVNYQSPPLNYIMSQFSPSHILTYFSLVDSQEASPQKFRTYFLHLQSQRNARPNVTHTNFNKYVSVSGTESRHKHVEDMCMQVSNKDRKMFPQKPQNIISPYQG
jgi:hypothetical protein